MDIHAIYRLILPHFRRRRFKRFAQTFHPDDATTILDVGGYPWCWDQKTCAARLTMLNMHMPSGLVPTAACRLVQGDGTRQPFADRSFDIAYSNSVIEHLSNFENQRRFAEELRRVGKRVWVQTPARWFVIEPHLLAPFVHYLPKSWQRRLLRYCTLWGWITRPTPDQVEAMLQEIRLLTYAEMRALFPDCTIHRERFFFMTKSFIAIR